MKTLLGACIIIQGTILPKLIKVLCNSNLVDDFLKFGEKVGLKLIGLLGIGVLLVPEFRTGSGIIFKPDINLWNPEVAVKITFLACFELSLFILGHFCA